MAFRSVFGPDKPSNKQILEDFKSRILSAKQSGDLQTEADAIIDRIVTHVSNSWALERYNKQLESRYNIANAELRRASREEAMAALKQGIPIIAENPRGTHWIMVQQSPRGILWGANPLPGYDFGSFTRDPALGMRFEIIVDATTKKAIEPRNAGAYKK